MDYQEYPKFVHDRIAKDAEDEKRISAEVEGREYRAPGSQEPEAPKAADQKPAGLDLAKAAKVFAEHGYKEGAKDPGAFFGKMSAEDQASFMAEVEAYKEQ